MPERLVKGSAATQQVIDLYEAGFSLRQVAAHTGRPRSTVKDCLVRNGIELRPPYGGHSRLDHRGVERVIFMYVHLRMSLYEIAAHENKHYRTVHGYLEIAGIPRRSRSEALRLRFARMPRARRVGVS